MRLTQEKFVQIILEVFGVGAVVDVLTKTTS